VRLEQDEVTTLYFKDSETLDQFDLEILLGDVTVELFRTDQEGVLMEHPCPMNATHHLDHNIVKFSFRNIEPMYYDNPNRPEKQEYFFVRIACVGEVFQGTAMVRAKGAIQLLSDGDKHDFSFSYSLDSKKEPESLYFMYMPASHKFDLRLNAQLKSFQSEQMNLFDLDKGKKVKAGSTGKTAIDPKFFDFRVALKKIRL